MIGWYVHHQGRGHLHRAKAIAAHLDEELTILSSLPSEEWATWVALPRDDLEGSTDATPGGRLHWAPVDSRGHQERFATIAAWVAVTRPRLMVVDVSVEVTTLVRMMGVPVVVMGMPGERDDAPHDLGHDLADLVIAPWPGELYEPGYLRRRPGLARYVGGITRYADRLAPPVAPPTPAPDAPGTDAPGTGAPARRVLLLGGAGGSALTPGHLAAARAATPGWQWSVAGPLGAWYSDVWELLHDTDVVVVAAGQNSVADVAAAGTRAVVVPEDRPFDEQRATADALRRAGLAVVRDAWPDDWAATLEEAYALEPSWERWRTAGAPARAAAILEGWRR
ncbi:glycosyltransferase [Arsenicicoccus dermatophilus]|uniref:glycosyltransferase n=1 Tax=Arsenicicoccus dermatophilus TaxID=1076331 RepID=UPI001F4CE0F1|nr:glycosyltransferase [Arsenicicoccus dermatophilus]MCH8611938.1 hypothetical protein [Arsenicicoccus dermatophilus]